MTIYFVIFFLLLCAVIAGFRPKASIMNSSLYSLATVLMVGCAGLRAESVGRDYGTYRIYFNASPDTVGPGFVGQWSSTMPFVDVAYVYLNSLVKKAGLPFEALIFLVALIVVALYAVFFWKHSRFSAIALIFYFSHAFLNKEMIQIRAGLASVIGLWAFHFWAGDRKRWGGCHDVISRHDPPGNHSCCHSASVLPLQGDGQAWLCSADGRDGDKCWIQPKLGFQPVFTG